MARQYSRYPRLRSPPQNLRLFHPVPTSETARCSTAQPSPMQESYHRLGAKNLSKILIEYSRSALISQMRHTLTEVVPCVRVTWVSSPAHCSPCFRSRPPKHFPIRAGPIFPIC